MEVIVLPSVPAIAEAVADAIALELDRDPEAVLGLATGGTPVPTYQELIRRHRQWQLSFAEAHVFLLDEYVGLPIAHPQSCRRFIERELTAHIDLPTSSLQGPDGNSIELDPAADRYETQLKDAGGVDLQLLGIGRNGHIGFNEPPSAIDTRTRVVPLSTTTRDDNARFFGGNVDDVPTHAITQGIGTILEASRLILIATGPAKADAVARAIDGPVTAHVPASALQRHPEVTIVLDEAAASNLRRPG